MGRRLNLAHLSEEECEQVLQVIQRDFELRQKEKERLGKIEEEVKDEDHKTLVLAKQKTFNENCCMRCFSRFIFIINQKVQCYQCKYFICKGCSDYSREQREYVCNVCKKQGELSTQSLGWFYDNIKNKFKRFGSAKVVRSLYKRRTDSDSEPELHYEPPPYSSEPVGRRSRGSLKGLFGLDNADLTKERESEVVEDVVAAERTPSRSFTTPYSCSVATGRDTFENFKDAELKTYNSQLKIVLRDISRTLERHSPTPGHTHQQERDLLRDQQFQLSSILANLSQSLHIAVDNQDPSESPASPVARHQLVKDVLVKEVEQFTNKPVALSSITRDGPQSYEEQLANIILNKVVDDFHQRVLQDAKDEESDVRRMFTKLSNKVTIEQIQDRYISEPDTDVTSSQVDEFTSDAESRLAEVTELSLADIQIGGDEVLGLPSGERKESKSSADVSRSENGLDTNENYFHSPRDSDSGIVSSPTTEQPSGFRHDASEESDELMHSPRHSGSDQIVRHLHADTGMIITTSEPKVEKLQTVIGDNNNITKTLTNGNVSSPRNRSSSNSEVFMSDSSESHDMSLHSIDENHIPDRMVGNDQQWEVIASTMNHTPPGERSRTRSNRNRIISRSKVPSIADNELDDIVKNNLINEKWSLVESRPSQVLSDDESDDTQRFSAASKDVTLVNNNSLVRSPDSSFHKHDNVFNSTPHNVEAELQELKPHHVEDELKQLKQLLPATKPIPISRQVHHDEVESLNDSDVTIGDDKNSPEGTPIVEPFIHKNLVVREKLDPFGDDEEEEEEFFDSEQERSHVPLPSFIGSGRLAFESGDLDDISSLPANEEEDAMSTFSTEISFGRTWNFSGTENMFRDRNKISAYDNFGEKKVGRDVSGPVIMLVPNGVEDTSNIRVGDRDVDDLSDLSENETRSDISSLDSDTAEEDDVSDVKDAMRHILRHDDPQTKAENPQMPRSPSPPTSPPVTKNILQNSLEPVSVETRPAVQQTKISVPEITADRLLAMDLVSIDSENGDPKFVILPADVTVMEGEVARFSCRLSGTDPLDVFWHKEGTELVQLNDHDSCESHSDGMTYYLDMFNTTIADQSQILCIGVNDAGRCVQGIRLLVEDNPDEKKAPEFLKSLHDAEVKVGSRVKFRVKLSGYPQPKVTWFKDGKKLSSSIQHRLEKQGNRDYLLCMDYTSLDDDADYTVIAKNIVGEARSSAQLVVDEQGSDAEVSSVSSSRVSLPISPPPSVVRSVSSVSDDVRGLYPDTDELLKLAEKVSQTRGDVTTTASKMLRSAGQMSTLHQEIDEMDRKLSDMEDEVKETDHIAMETEAYKEIYRDELLREHEEMQTSAYALRNVTSTALDILQSADDIIQASKDPQSLKRKSDLLSPISSEPEEEVELKLTFIQFDKLYSAGKITKDQMSSGKVRRAVHDDCMEYLRNEPDIEPEMDESHDLVVDDMPTSIDCGLKRVDSKRYKRDYNINREAPKSAPRKWEVKLAPGLQKAPAIGQDSIQEAEVVKSTPAGTREVAHDKINEAEQQVDSESESRLQFYDHQADSRLARYPIRGLPPIAEINQVEDEIYLAAGRVSHLQDKIERLEDKVNDTEDETMADLEDQVARAAAQVKTHERQVSLVEEHVRTLETQTKEAEEDRPEGMWRHLLSPVGDRPAPSFNDFESQHRDKPERPKSLGDHPRVTTEVKVKPMPTQMVRSPEPVKSPQAVRIQSPVRSQPPVHNVTKSWLPAKTLPPVQSPPPIQSTPPVVSPPRPKPEPINLHGISSEDVLPESRTEYEDTIGLPSVKNLRSMFNQGPAVDDNMKKDGTNVKRVYSLTGRDLPKTVREKLRGHSPVKTSNPNVRSASEDSRRPPLTALFEDRRPDGGQTGPRSSTPIEVTSPRTRARSASSSSSSSGASWRDTSPGNHVKSTASLNLSNVSSGVGSPVRAQMVTNTHQQHQPNTHQQQRVHQQPSVHQQQRVHQQQQPNMNQHRQTQHQQQQPPRTHTQSKVTSRAGPPRTPTSPTSPPHKQPLQRQTSSTIMARAKFWDTRINDEVVSDIQAHVEQFPEMPDDNFKSTEDLHYSS